MVKKSPAAQAAEVTKRIDREVRDMKSGLARGLYEAAWAIAADSQELVPVDFGPLKGSLDVTRPEGNNPSVTISYGDTAVAYAAYQHRGMRADGTHVVRQYDAPGKQKNYLQEPLEKEIETWPEGLIKRMR